MSSSVYFLKIVHFASMSLNPSGNEPCLACHLIRTDRKSSNSHIYLLFRSLGKRKEQLLERFKHILVPFQDADMKPYKKYFEKTTKISQTL